MSLAQILVIWGAASAALFSFPVHSGEWENFKDLKEALVRSSARRDVPLPAWAASLEYHRPFHFYDVGGLLKPEKKHDSPITSNPARSPLSGASGNGRLSGDKDLDAAIVSH